MTSQIGVKKCILKKILHPKWKSSLFWLWSEIFVKIWPGDLLFHCYLKVRILKVLSGVSTIGIWCWDREWFGWRAAAREQCSRMGGRCGDRPVTNGKICSVVGSWGTCSLSIRMSVKRRRLVLCVCLALGKRWPHTSASAASAPHASGWHEDLGFLKVTGSEDVPVFDILWPYCKHRSVIWWLVADGICIHSLLSGLLNVSG